MRRSFWAAELVAIYSALASVRADDGRGLSWMALFVGPLAVALVFRWLDTWPATRDPALGHAARAVATGAVSVAWALAVETPAISAVVAANEAVSAKLLDPAMNRRMNE